MKGLVIGIAKTGTTVISKTIQNSIESCSYHLEPKNTRFFENPKHIEGNRVVKILFEHWNDRPFIRQAIVRNEFSLKFDKKICIVRDLRDQLISALIFRTIAVGSRKGTKEQVLKWLSLIEEKEKDQYSHSLTDLMLKFNDIFKVNFSINDPTFEDYFNFLEILKNHVYIIKYEDFIDYKLNSLESYLEFQLTESRDVGDLSKTARTKSYGNWRSFILKSDIEAIKKGFGHLLDRYGYNDWELNELSPLTKETGSEYIKKELNEARARQEKNPLEL